MIDKTILALFSAIYGIKPWEIGDKLSVYQYQSLVGMLPIMLLLKAGSPELAGQAFKLLEKIAPQRPDLSTAELIKKAREVGLNPPTGN